MNINPENKDALSGSLFTGGNSSPANPTGYNGSPLAASKVDKNHKLKSQRAFEILKSGHTLWHSIVRAARLGHTATLLELLYRMKNLIEIAIRSLDT